MLCPSWAYIYAMALELSMRPLLLSRYLVLLRHGVDASRHVSLYAIDAKDNQVKKQKQIYTPDARSCFKPLMTSSASMMSRNQLTYQFKSHGLCWRLEENTTHKAELYLRAGALWHVHCMSKRCRYTTLRFEMFGLVGWARITRAHTSLAYTCICLINTSEGAHNSRLS